MAPVRCWIQLSAVLSPGKTGVSGATLTWAVRPTQFFANRAQAALQPHRSASNHGSRRGIIRNQPYIAFTIPSAQKFCRITRSGLSPSAASNCAACRWRPLLAAPIQCTRLYGLHQRVPSASPAVMWQPRTGSPAVASG